MALFGKYAQFYDALYQDKDYRKECDFLETVFKKYSRRKIQTVLDLGCGTAAHDVILAKRGYGMTGVDRSSAMLQVARQKIKRANLNVQVQKGNIQTVRLHRKYDAVISMFDVMSYQRTLKAFERSLDTARTHLKRGGIFIFDAWFGPAVLKHRPEFRVKVVSGRDGEKIVRESRPKIDVMRQTVEVGFNTKQYAGNKLISVNRESHKMRFFFLDEISILLKKHGFRIKKIGVFHRLWKSVSANDWKMVVLCGR